MSGPILKPSGYLRLAAIKSINQSTMTAKIVFRNSISGTDDGQPTLAQLPMSYLSSGGGFIGGWIGEGTPVVVGQAEGGGHYFIVAFLARDPASQTTIKSSKLQIPTFIEGQLSIRANSDGGIDLNDNGITIGDPNNQMVFDINNSILLHSFDSSYSFTQGSRNIDGIIKRDKKPKRNVATSLRLTEPSYDKGLQSIGMDPIALTRTSSSGSATRNPARVEKRELYYEYEQDADTKSNDVELKNYGSNASPVNQYIISRRGGRADTLSLSLVSPNYLIETIRGTVVDLYGNILDINRSIIPIGKDTLSVSNIKSTTSESDTFKNIYEEIKRQERKSVAFHFELNARKETTGSGPPDVTDRSNYARARSRFSLDIDKEGQIKLNVPASSETGNIPLLTRYENYSTVFPNSKTNDPDDLVFNDDYKDILVESFLNNAPIALQDDLGNIVGPIDRFSTSDLPLYIKHGTVYHDISKTCDSFQTGSNYTPVEYVTTTNIASGRVPLLTNIVSPTIITTGPNANAGGRSGSLNFDGSLEINIGANTVDRQSLWVDTQGGILANIGRDLNNGVSLGANLDGDLLIQVGGPTVPAETNRFQGASGFRSGTVDVRVYNENLELTILRIDKEGLTVTTPGRIVFSANQNMMFRSNSTIYFDAENIIANGRSILKDPGKGPIR
jgi:hypothetical protein